MISTFAKKVLLWFRLYKVSPTEYSDRVGNITKGDFKSVLEELVEAEEDGTEPTSVVSSTNSATILLGEKYVLSTYILPELTTQEYVVTISTPAKVSVVKSGTTVNGDNKWTIVGKQVGTTNVTFKSVENQSITKVVAITVAALSS